MKKKWNPALALATLVMAILPVLSAVDQQLHASGAMTRMSGLFPEQAEPPRRPSCASPTVDMIAGCAIQVEQIMASTIRLEIRDSGKKSISHATVAGGRYLITHNHFPRDLSATGTSYGKSAPTLTLHRANGDLIVRNIPLSIFTVLTGDEEILILDFHEFNETGFFDRLGIPSAELKWWDEIPIQVGDEVAQVVWDGATTSVGWARVSFINGDPRVPGLEMESTLLRGASGGGVFVNGYHIGNNWLKGTNYRHDTRDPSRKYSVAAMNSEVILTLGSPYERVTLATE